MSTRINRQEVPVQFDGNVLLVKNVTKYTTCSDVVHMLLLKSGFSVERISSYVMFEATGDLERMLSGRTRIIKTLRSWGCENDNFRFVLRKIGEDEQCRLMRYSNIRYSCKISKFVAESPGSQQEQNMNNGVNSINNDSSLKYSHETLPTQKGCENTMKRSHIRVISTEDKMHLPEKNGKHSKTENRRKSKGKQVCFKKYLSNLIRFRKPKRPLQNDSKSGGIMKTGRIEPTHKDSNDNLMTEIDDLLHDQFVSLEERCRFYWNSNSESDEESDFDDEASFNRESDLNNAFLKGVTTEGAKLNVGASFDYSKIYCGDLNDAFVNEHNGLNDSSYLSDILEDHFESLSENSDCELDRNITSCDVVRNIFCGHSLDGTIAEDDEMDSFMRTHIYEPDSEESLV